MPGKQEVLQAIENLMSNIKIADDQVELLHKKIDEAPTTDISEAFATELLGYISNAEAALAKVPTKEQLITV